MLLTNKIQIYILVIVALNENESYLSVIKSI